MDMMRGSIEVSERFSVHVYIYAVSVKCLHIRSMMIKGQGLGLAGAGAEELPSQHHPRSVSNPFYYMLREQAQASKVSMEIPM